MLVIVVVFLIYCFDVVYDVCKIVLEYMILVVLLIDGFVVNGFGVWKLFDLVNYLVINLFYVILEMKDNYIFYKCNVEIGVCYWVLLGQEGYMYILGGLEKDSDIGVIFIEFENYNLMCCLCVEKVVKILVFDVKV